MSRPIFLKAWGGAYTEHGGFGKIDVVETFPYTYRSAFYTLPVADKTSFGIRPRECYLIVPV